MSGSSETVDRAAQDEPTLQPAGAPRRALSLFDVALILGHRARLLVVVPLLVGVITLGVSYLIPPMFTASTQLLPPQQQSSTAAALLGSLGGVAGVLGGAAGAFKNPTDQWIALLKSRVVADAIVDRFKLVELYESDYRFQARDRLASRSRIAAARDGLITIEVEDHDPQRAADMTSAYIEELQRLTTTLAVTEAAQRRLFFQRQLAEAKENLVKAEIALKSGGISADVVKTSPTAAVSQLAQLQASISAQEVRLAAIRGRMTEQAPEYRQAELQLASLREQLRRVEQDQPGSGKGDSAEYVSRYREYKYFETLFDLFARQYEVARADEAREGAVVQVVDPVLVPEYKSSPKRARMAILATLFTFLLVAAWVLLRHSLRTMGSRPDGAAKLALLRTSLGLRRHD